MKNKTIKENIKMDEDDDNNNNNTKQTQEDQIILYVLVVGFHHKKGCLIDFCYPPLPQCCDVFYCDSSISTNNAITDDNENNENSNQRPKMVKEDSENSSSSSNSSNNDLINLPELWKTLPSLAIPDGAHNFDDDTVYFHLPDLNNPNRTVFGVACYQQILTKKLLVKTPDMTRSSVQKSVVAILRYPLYGFVEQKLRIVTRSYFNQLDFSQTTTLKEFYSSLSCQLKYNMLKTNELNYGLSLQTLFNKFGQQVIILFKLFLLEKKILFIMSPIRDLSSAILSICSLFPGLLQEGMLQSHLPIQLEHKQDDQSDKTQIDDETYCDNITTTTKSSSSLSSAKTKQFHEYLQSSIESTISTYDDYVHNDDNLFNNEDSDDDNDDDYSAERRRYQTEILKKPYEYYGLPLQLFKCNSYCLPYCSISCFECLNGERVRACIAGSSNSIFQRWENDIDVFVVDNQIIINDSRLKRILTPTVEDLRFMSFISQNMNPTSTLDLFKDLEIGENFESKKRISSAMIKNDSFSDDDSQQPYKGSDAWCRYHFKSYLLHMLRCSLLDESTREYRSFNPSFMTEWKMTYNYKNWSYNNSIVELFKKEIDPQHPFAANRLNDIRFKITNFINNHQENINQASKVIMNTAKTTFSSWITSLSSYGPGQQAKSLLSRTVQTFATQFIEDGDAESSSSLESEGRITPKPSPIKEKNVNQKGRVSSKAKNNATTKTIEPSIDLEEETSV